MTLTCFDVRYADQVAHLQLNRPEQRNSLIPSFWAELRTLVEDIDRNARARVIVISSTGKHFCAGLDLSVFDTGMFRAQGGGEEPGRKRAMLYEGVRSLPDTFLALQRARIPVITAIQGGCIGAAVSLAAASDLRYTTRDAFFLLQEINIAITPDVGQLHWLAKTMPDGLVREMAFRGTRLPAARAEQVGFVNEIFDDQQTLLAAVSDIATDMAAKSPLPMWGSKHVINHAREHSVEDGIDLVALWQSGMYHPDDTRESLRARSDGRDAYYENLRPTP
jgi:enoyl-CoA hydratase